MKETPPKTAMDLMGGGTASNPPQNARKLKLQFFGQECPQLDRAEFHCEETTQPGYWQQKAQNGDHSITWTKVPQAVSLIFLDYVSAGLRGSGGKFHFSGSRTGSLAASLGDAICKGEGKLFNLFAQFPKNGAPVSRVQNVFDGSNIDGKKARERHLWIKTDYLPFSAIEIFWESSRIKGLPEIEKLAGQIRNAEGFPPASKLKLPGDAARPEKTEPVKQPELPNQAKAPPERNIDTTETVVIEYKAPQTEAPKESDPSKEPAEEPNSEKPEPIPVSEQFPEIDVHRGLILSALEGGCSAFEIWSLLRARCSVDTEEQKVRDYIEGLLREEFPPGEIKPSLFAITETERQWANDTQLLGFILENAEPDYWTIGDACQGTLILGSPGSGKTTASGRTIAVNFLNQGFGGLVLTTKQSEVGDWIKLCGMVKRERDIAVVCPKGYLRLNMLQYEMERPSGGVKLTENLVSFFKNIASVVGRKSANQMNESFWENTGDELLQNTIDCFKLANFPITLDNLCSFILEAPLDLDAVKAEKWRDQPVFGSCITKAEDAVETEDDAGAFKIVSDYWLKAFPGLSPNTRSCITTGFSAMVRVLRSRYINDLLSTMTTITPESIFNGRIILLALPTNDYHDAGLMVQAAWKYLVQRAILSRADRTWGEKCRPVFIWEDEAQNFLIDFDTQFQPVAREYRVACVKLSQNISNFYARFGGGDAARTKVDAIIGSLNTRLFHANGDLATNEWASKTIGSEYKTVVNTSTTPSVYNGMNPWKGFLHGIFSQPTVTTSRNQVREPVLQPHEFTTLQTGNQGNNFVTITVVTQVGRKFPNGKDFFPLPFQQYFLPVLKSEQVLGDQAWKL